MKKYQLHILFLFISTIVSAQTSDVDFKYPLTIGTKWTYKYYRESGITGTTGKIRGIHHWEIISKNEYADSVVYNIVSTNQDTASRTWPNDSTFLDYNTTSFTIKVTPDSIIDYWPMSLLPNQLGYRIIPRFISSLSDTIVVPYKSVYVNNIGLVKFTTYYRSNNTEIDTLLLLSITKVPTHIPIKYLESDHEYSFTLFQSYPNPFNPNTIIRYTIPFSGNVRINIVDILGKLVRSVEFQTVEQGTHSFLWDAKDTYGNSVSSGIYFCYMIFNNQIKTQKLLLTK